MKKNSKLKVSIIMGSQSDFKVMKLAEKTLKKIGVLFETKLYLLTEHHKECMNMLKK